MLSSAVNQIHRWVDIVFPELRQVFKVLTCTSAIATLMLFPLPKEISRLTAEQVIAGWKQYVKRHAFIVVVHRAEQIKVAHHGSKTIYIGSCSYCQKIR